MPEPDFYRGLEETDPPTIVLSMAQLVSLVMQMNYGQHRFLSELIRQRQATPTNIWYLEEHTAMLEDVLNKGFF